MKSSKFDLGLAFTSALTNFVFSNRSLDLWKSLETLKYIENALIVLPSYANTFSSNT